jgi:ribonuclease HII
MTELCLSGSERILGIDEAGRGAVIGPLVICGAVCRADHVDDLVRIGTRDSKRYTRKGREKAAGLIRDIVEDSVFVVFSPEKIDTAVRCRQLNVLEATGMAEIINDVCPDMVYVDAVGRIVPGLYISGPGIRNFRQLLRELVRPRLELIIEHNADEKYPIVSAASVLAKVTRDGLVRELYEKYGEEFGSGYTDRKTTDFIIRYYREHRCFPEDMRMNWQTRRKILSLVTQKKLDDFPIEFRSCDREGAG